MRSNIIDDKTQTIQVKARQEPGRKYPIVELPDGRTLEVKPRPAKRKRKTGPSAGFSTNPEARTHLIVMNPSSYRDFDNMQMGTSELGGSPGIYPRQLYSLMFTLQNALTLKAMCQNLKFACHMQMIKENLSQALPHVQKDDQVRIENWLLNPKMPSASHLSRVLSQIRDRGVDTEEIVRESGLKIAIQEGRFSSTNSVYSQSNFIIGDGTVLAAATPKPPMEYIDSETGEIRQRRIDREALLHTEGSGNTTTGSKFAPVWSTDDHQHGTICLGVTQVLSTAPAVEAQRAIELVTKIQRELNEQGASASLLSYDRAVGVYEQEALNNVGMVAGTRAFVDTDEGSSSHFRKPKYIGHVIAPCGHNQRFVSILKRLHHEVRDVNGRTANKMLEHKLRPKRRGNRIFHYTEHPYTCWCSPDSIQILRISWNGRKAALGVSKNGIVLAGDKGYENMLRYLQPHAPNSDDFKIVHGKRQTSETMHSVIDDFLSFKRLQRWNQNSKASWVHGYLLGLNRVYEQLRKPGTIQALLCEQGV